MLVEVTPRSAGNTKRSVVLLAGGAERLDFAYASDASGKPTTTVTDYAIGSAVSRTYTVADIADVRYPTAVSAPCSLCGNGAGQHLRRGGQQDQADRPQLGCRARAEHPLLPTPTRRTAATARCAHASPAHTWIICILFARGL